MYTHNQMYTGNDVSRKYNLLDNQLQGEFSKRNDYFEGELQGLRSLFNNLSAANSGSPSMQDNNVTLQANQAIDYINHLEHKLHATNQNLMSLSQEMQNLASRLDEKDQYDMRNTLLVHKLDDVPVKKEGDEFFDRTFFEYIVGKLNDLFPTMQPKLTIRDIDDTHVLRTRKPSASKVVIVKFVSRFTRKLIFSLKKTLKNTPVAITEHLTAKNLKLLNDTKDVVGKKNVWTHYGKVLVNVNNSIRAIRNNYDIEKLVNYHPVVTHRDMRGAAGSEPVASPNTPVHPATVICGPE